MPSVDETNKKIEDLLNEWRSNYVPLLTAVVFIRGQMARRIFTKGKNKAGSSLPTVNYSTKPIYADVQSLPNKPSSYQIGTKGKKIKSAYFKGGYAELKQAVYRPPMELTGYLNKAFSNLAGIEVKGKTPPPENPTILNGDNAKIEMPSQSLGQIKGLEEKYGTIFEMSDSEEKEFTQVLSDEIAIAINKALE